MDLLAAAALGVVQGLTEFLPVSSSGHLILARAFFGWDAGAFGVAFDVACHVGTFLAVALYFRRDVAAMVAATPGAVALREGGPERLVRLVAVGTLPIVAAGLLFSDWVEGPVRSPAVVAAMLALGGVGLVAAERLGRHAHDAGAIGYAGALAIGVAQAAALVPGVSRSGATLTVALLLGVRREPAARFVFLLSLPAVLAAAGKAGLELAEAGGTVPAGLFAVGLVVSAGVGYLTIKYFLRYLASHTLTAFAVYRFALSGVTLAWLMG
ncbi:MAG: undecaprenyl-diphosphate phosphatase [Acidobacteriota bacterium]